MSKEVDTTEIKDVMVGGNVSFSDGTLRVTDVKLNDEQLRILNKFLYDNAGALTNVDIHNIVNKSPIPLNASWISRAINLRGIDMVGTSNIISEALVEQIAANDSIVSVSYFDATIGLEHGAQDEALHNKIEDIVSQRSSNLESAPTKRGGLSKAQLIFLPCVGDTAKVAVAAESVASSSAFAAAAGAEDVHPVEAVKPSCDIIGDSPDQP